MRVFFPVLFSMLMIGVLSLVELLLRLLHPDWWKHRWVRRVSYGVPVLGLAGLSLWALGIAIDSRVTAAIGATTASVVFVVGAALMLSLPLSGIVHVLVRWLSRRGIRRRQVPVHDVPVQAGRRRLLTTAAAAFPALALGAAGSGLAGGAKPAIFPSIPLFFPNLPPALDGLRIAHVSDVHIGLALGLEDYERMAEGLQRLRPDLLLINGDFSDEVDAFPAALRMTHEVRAPLGAFASIGNHEYFRGITEIFRAYDRGPVPLLLDRGTRVSVGDASLWIAGIDDPRSLGRMAPDFFDRTIDRAVNDAHDNDFVIALSHRPEAFDPASRRGIPLTLAGHTHGGQIAIAGRSALEYVRPDKYMWGRYSRGEALLSVSGGAGHWFPWRLGVPAEIPVYTLRRGSGGDARSVA